MGIRLSTGHSTAPVEKPAQVTKAGALLAVFALAILPVVFFLGLVTYGRLVQITLEDVVFSRAISRIHHFYATIDPGRARFFEERAVEHVELGKGFFSLQWQQFLPMAEMVAVVNSVVGGVFIAAIVALAFTPPTAVAALVGAISTFAIAIFFLANQRRQWATIDRIDPLEPIGGD